MTEFQKLIEAIENLLEQEMSSIFSMEKFKSLIPREQMEYALDTLQILSNEGGGRVVFDLGENKVLKVARDNKSYLNGVSQNKKELAQYPKLKQLNIVPEIFDYDKDNFNWIIAEKVSVFSTDKDFESQTGIFWDEMESLFRDNGPITKFGVDKILNPESYPNETEEILNATDFGEEGVNHKLISALLKAVKNGLRQEEILVPSHFGLTKNGDVVIVDFGY